MKNVQLGFLLSVTDTEQKVYPYVAVGDCVAIHLLYYAVPHMVVYEDHAAFVLTKHL